MRSNLVKSESLIVFDDDEILIQLEDTFLINEHTSQGRSFKEKLIRDYLILAQENNHIANIMLNET